MEKTDLSYAAMLSLFAEMVLDDSIRTFRMERLHQQIDRALEQKDVRTFLALTDELKSL